VNSTSEVDPRRWWTLGVLVGVQLMIMLDVTIVNVALPSAQSDLDIRPGDRQWVLTAYALAFGGLLLLGGRIADRVGRRRALLWALGGFALASALGGLAWAPGALFAARAVQGAFGAVLAPAVLASISLLFPHGADRARAFGVYSAVSAGGGAMGLVVGGVLTEYISWRWCLLVNVPIAALTMVAALRWLPESRAQHAPERFDVLGAVLATSASFVLVYAAAHASEAGWGSTPTVALLLAAVVLTVAFVLAERAARDPLLPLGVLTDRVRAGAFASTLLSFGANTGVLLLMLVYLQSVLGQGAVDAGLAFLPLMVGAAGGAAVATRALGLVTPRTVICAGFLSATVGVALLTSVDADTEYMRELLVPLVLDGFGVGLLFVPLASLAVAGVADRDSGVASAAFNAIQQIGSALGAAVVNTVAVAATAGAGTGPAALAHGTGRGLLVSALLMAGGMLAAAVLVNARREAMTGRAAPTIA